MKRRIAFGVVLTVAVLAVAHEPLDYPENVPTLQTPTTTPPVTVEIPNGSSDGRYHTCGYITEHGVTEHLDAYRQRCSIDPEAPVDGAE